MKARFLILIILLTVGWLLVAGVGFHRVLGSRTYTLAVDTSLTNSSTVTITYDGIAFNPANLTVAVGTTLQWINQSSRDYTLSGSLRHQLYLPLLASSKFESEAQSLNELSEPSVSYDQPLLDLITFRGILQANGSYSYTVTNVGQLDYLLEGIDSAQGVVNVIQNAPTPTIEPTSTPTAIETLTATLQPTETVSPTTPAPDTVTETPTTTGTLTPTLTSSSTPTFTPSATATASNTLTLTATQTQTPTPSVTALATIPKTSTLTKTPSRTPTVTPSKTATPTYTSTSTKTPTPTATASNTATSTATPTSASGGPTYVCGSIETNTTWRPESNPYVLTCSITVNAGVTLTIQPDVIVKAGTNEWFSIQGTLLAVGDPLHSVTFTSINDDSAGGDTNQDGNTQPAVGDWGGIHISASGAATFAHAWVMFGGNISVTQGQLTVTDSRVAYGGGSGISVNGSSPVIKNTVIDYNEGPGIILAESPSPDIQDNIIKSNQIAISLGLGKTSLTGTPIIKHNAVVLNNLNGIVIDGTIIGNRLLPNFEHPYVITSNGLNIAVGATLRVAADVVIKSSLNAGIVVAGTLLAEGEATHPVVFTSILDDTYGGDTPRDGGTNQPAIGDWSGIDILGDATLDYAVIRYSGVLHAQGQLTVRNSTIGYGGINTIGSALVVTNSQFIGNPVGIAVGINNKAVAPVIQNNTFQNNSDSAMSFGFENGSLSPSAQINNNSGSNHIRIGGSISGTMLLPDGGLPYVLDSWYGSDILTVRANSTLYIAPGVVFKASTNDFFVVYGTLLALGDTLHPVVFTSIHDDSYGGDTNHDGYSQGSSGDWSGIHIQPKGSATFNRAVVQYAHITVTEGQFIFTHSRLAYSAGYGLDIIRTSPEITNNSFEYNAGPAILLSESDSPRIQDNTFSHNQGVIVTSFGDVGLTGNVMINGNSAFNNWINGISIAGNVSGSQLLPDTDLPYVLDPTYADQLTVLENSTLRIPPGTTIKFGFNKTLLVYGELVAEGNAASPIVFTSLADDSYGGDTDNSGNSDGSTGDWNGINILGNATFAHAIIRYGGISHSGGQLSITNSTIAYGYGVSIAGNSTSLVTVHGSNIYENSFGISNGDPDHVVNATGNWWGASSGPDPYGTGNGINYELCFNPILLIDEPCNFHVDADPWLTQLVAN